MISRHRRRNFKSAARVSQVARNPGMADDELKDAGGPETGRPKREPPTIDLDASEVSGETRAAAEAKAEAHAEAAPEPEPVPVAEQTATTPSKPISPWVIAPFSGAVA